jgi:hypothetical protein
MGHSAAAKRHKKSRQDAIQPEKKKSERAATRNRHQSRNKASTHRNNARSYKSLLAGMEKKRMYYINIKIEI